SGLYVDGVLQAGRHRADVRAYGALGSQAKGSSLLASVEVGRAFAVAPGWTVEPQLQLVHQRLSLDDTLIQGLTTVQQDAASGWAVRAGVRVAGSFTTAAGVLQPYARLNLWHSGSGTDRARFVGPAAFTDVSTRTGGSRTELAVGANWQITPAVAAYGELGQLWSSGGGTKTKGGPSASVGVKLRW
ncbi:MAG: autotransporter outer membrane beta-barrel domain-containing protein, partial [Comamonadaceae bacterium]